MLVDHSDAVANSVSWSVERDRFAVDEDLPRIGSIQTGQDAHERGLASAVFAEQRVHLAPPSREVDVLVGHDAREALVDPQHGYGYGDVAPGGHVSSKTIPAGARTTTSVRNGAAYPERMRACLEPKTVTNM